MFSYIFLIRIEPTAKNKLINNITIDSFHKFISDDEYEYCKLKEDFSSLEEHVAILNSMKLRMRFNTSIIPRILKVKSDMDINIQILEMYIQSLDHKQLEDFINESGISY